MAMNKSLCFYIKCPNPANILEWFNQNASLANSDILLPDNFVNNLPNGKTANWHNVHKALEMVHDVDAYLKFYESIKTQIRSVSFECQKKIQRVFAFVNVSQFRSFPRGLLHFTIIILSVKLSNG